MLVVEVRHSFQYSAEKVWALTGEFSGLNNWLPGVVDCQVEGAGPRDQGGDAVRHVHMMDGSVTKESLESFSADELHYRYAILEAKGFDSSSQFLASFKVVPLGEGQCDVIWQAQITLPATLPAEKAEKAKQRVQQMYQFFLQHLAGVLD